MYFIYILIHHSCSCFVWSNLVSFFIRALYLRLFHIFFDNLLSTFNMTARISIVAYKFAFNALLWRFFIVFLWYSFQNNLFRRFQYDLCTFLLFLWDLWSNQDSIFIIFDSFLCFSTCFKLILYIFILILYTSRFLWFFFVSIITASYFYYRIILLLVRKIQGKMSFLHGCFILILSIKRWRDRMISIIISTLRFGRVLSL